MNSETVELRKRISKKLPDALIEESSTVGFWRSYDVLVIKKSGKRLIIEAFGPWIMITEESNDKPVADVVEAAMEIAPDKVFKNQDEALQYIVKVLS